MLATAEFVGQSLKPKKKMVANLLASDSTNHRWTWFNVVVLKAGGGQAVRGEIGSEIRVVSEPQWLAWKDIFYSVVCLSNRGTMCLFVHNHQDGLFIRSRVDALWVTATCCPLLKYMFPTETQRQWRWRRCHRRQTQCTPRVQLRTFPNLFIWQRCHRLTVCSQRPQAAIFLILLHTFTCSLFSKMS